MSPRIGEKKSTVAFKSSRIAESALSGILWNYIGSISASVCTIAIGIVLARILGPRPFGQVIIASTIYGFLNLFVDGGFSQALIQKRTLDQDDIRKTFTCQVGIGLCATVAVYLSAPWFARQFRDPSAVHVIEAMSLVIAIQSTGLVSSALLRREMRFKAVQCAALSSYLFGYCVLGIPLAIRGAGVWSLVLAYLSQCLLNSILLNFSARHSMTPQFALPDRSMATFGGTIIANNVVNWGHLNLDNLAASRLGPVALGLYGRGCNFAYQPVNTVVSGLQSVLFSSAAKVQEKQRVMKDLTLAVIAIVSGVLGSAYTVLAMNPGTIVLGLYGDKWTSVIPLMIPLAIAMPFYGAHCLLGPILCGLGHPELEFWPQAVSCAVAAATYFTAVRFSLLSLAWALVLVAILRLGMIAAFTFHLLGISWAQVTLLVIKRIGFSVAFGGAAWCVNQLFHTLRYDSSLRLGILTVFCIIVLSGSIWFAGNIVFGRHAVRFMLNYAVHFPACYVKQLWIQAGTRNADSLMHS